MSAGGTAAGGIGTGGRAGNAGAGAGGLETGGGAGNGGAPGMPTLCDANQHVQANACVACGAGTTNAAGDDASGANTTCDATLCGVNQHVQANACAACGAGATNAAGDDASGANTRCDDACTAAFDVTCAQFEEGYLKASNTGIDDQFGYPVSLSGDTLAVGAWGESSAATGVNGDQSSNAATYSGAVYVFTRSAGVWTQQAYLKASNTDSGDQFGYSVSLSGDTLAVGAWYEDSAATGRNGDQSSNAASQSGAVYVFTRSAGVWTQQAYLKASNTDSGDQFGYSVSLSGDTLAVGAWGESGAATGVNGDQSSNSAFLSGAVYVFTRSAGVWTQQAYLKASNTDSGDQFGWSVSLLGDTLAVGSPDESSAATGVNGDQSSNAGTYSGAVYVFTRSAGVWSQQVYLKASNTDNLDYFGSSVSLSANTLAVGSTGDDSAATGVNGDQNNAAAGSGAVYVFARNAGVWNQQAYLKASNTGSNDNFGYSVSLSGDTLAVGAPLESSAATGVNGDQSSNAASGSGAAYVQRIAP